MERIRNLTQLQTPETIFARRLHSQIEEFENEDSDADDPYATHELRERKTKASLRSVPMTQSKSQRQLPSQTYTL